MTTLRPPMTGILIALAALGVSATAARAESPVTVRITVPVEVQIDSVTNADDASEGTDTFTKIEPEIVVGLPHGFSIQTGLVFEPLRDRTPGEDRFFESHGLFVEQLQLIWESGPVTLHAGKFNATFAFDPGYSRGMYGDTFMEDYELTERLGFGGGVTIPVEGVAEFRVAGSLFTRDRTDLERAAITARDRLRASDATPGNTDGLENGAVAVDMTPAFIPDLLLRASYLRQGAGEGETSDQTAWGLGADYRFEVADGITVAPMIDWVHSDGAIGFTDGTSLSGAATDHITAGVQVLVGPWLGNLSHGWRTIDDPSVPANVRDRFTQVSAGYEFDFGLALEAGWLDQVDGGVESSTVGLQAAYTVEF